MTIHKEFYRDFIGTINTRREEIQSKLNSIQFDEESWIEYGLLDAELCRLTDIQEFFMDSSRWGYFESLALLKLYVQNIGNAYDSINTYSRSVLPVDGGDTIGVSQEEWDELETTRYHLLKKLEAWSMFADFCENGTI